METMVQIKTQRIWTEEEIKNLIQTNDKVLYGALKGLYAFQTEEERKCGNTQESNGVGFNAWDAPFLSAMYKDLEKWGHLTKGQKEKTRTMIAKYNKQLTEIANKSKHELKDEVIDDYDRGKLDATLEAIKISKQTIEQFTNCFLDEFMVKCINEKLHNEISNIIHMKRE